MVERWSIDEGHDSTSLKFLRLLLVMEIEASGRHHEVFNQGVRLLLKVCAQKKVYYTRDCASEGSKLFGSTKPNFEMPPGAECVSH